MDDQYSLFKPAWPECFKTCKHFDSHPDYPPDYFPWPPNMKRCQYCEHEYGTLGAEMTLLNEGRSVEMYCKYYEQKEN